MNDTNKYKLFFPAYSIDNEDRLENLRVILNKMVNLHDLSPVATRSPSNSLESTDASLLVK
jgi:hypothetical protein